MATVTSLHGTTPSEIFQSGLENLDEIEAVAVCVRWRNGAVTTGWSNVDQGDLALMVLALKERLRQQIIRDLE